MVVVAFVNVIYKATVTMADTNKEFIWVCANTLPYPVPAKIPILTAALPLSSDTSPSKSLFIRFSVLERSLQYFGRWLSFNKR